MFDHLEPKPIDVKSVIPFALMHLACVPALWLVPTRPMLYLCLGLYLVRMFGITAGFHRYFSHRSFATSRPFQFVLAWLGTSAAQLGPLWWAAHHRHHHAHSDTHKDIHPPTIRGLLWSHMGWIFCPEYRPTDHRKVKDFARYPELRFLDDYPLFPPIVLALSVLGLGYYWQAPLTTLVWGFFVSTIFLYHGTFCINSLAHLLGTRRYETKDDSRNSLFLALITLGEGWHNNHHRYPSSARQGFFWWEVDMTHWILLALAKCGLIWGIRKPPASAYESL